MSSINTKIREISQSITFNLSSILIPLFQYVPTASIWFGIMSIPLISYLFFFFQFPGVLESDLVFFLEFHGTYVVYFGLGLYLYCLIFQLTHRNQLIQTGPYRLVRHPQYIAFIIITLGLTLISFQTSPIVDFNPFSLNEYIIVFYIWIIEVIAYIILGKIEEIALKSKYGDEYINYANKVSFMVPFLNIRR
jgi:protein-S-isoprenylcysteine O-methyltransferase Ste14